MIRYVYDNIEYNSLYSLKTAMFNISLPNNITNEDLEALNVKIVEYHNPKIPLTLDQAIENKKTEISSSRWLEETSGITIKDIKIATDRESVSLLNGAITQAIINPEYTVKWKTSSGFITLNTELLFMLGTAVRTHVQNCFNKEADLLELLENVETFEDVEAISWNSQL